MADIIFTNIVGNDLLTLVVSREIDFREGSVMVWGGIFHGLKSQLIVIAGNLTEVGYRDQVLPHLCSPSCQAIPADFTA